MLLLLEWGAFGEKEEMKKTNPRRLTDGSITKLFTFMLGQDTLISLSLQRNDTFPPTLLWPLLVSPLTATLGIPLMFYCNLICYNFVSLFAFYIAFRLSRAAISSENEPFLSLLPSRFNSQFAVRCRRPGVKELNGRCEMPTTFASPRLN